MKCSECDCPIVMWNKYFQHKDGTILCYDCFQKLVKEGKIK